MEKGTKKDSVIDTSTASSEEMQIWYEEVTTKEEREVHKKHNQLQQESFALLKNLNDDDPRKLNLFNRRFDMSTATSKNLDGMEKLVQEIRMVLSS